MAIAHHTATSRWADQITNGPEERSMVGSNVMAYGDSIFSYGPHFEMGRIVRDGRGNPKFVLLNGDRYSVTTSSHQSHVRASVRHPAEQAGIPVIIVPHTALAAAGIDLDEIRPLEVRPDRYVPRKRSARELPEHHTLDDDGRPLIYTTDANGHYDYVHAIQRDDGLWHWTSHEHVLGDSLFTARITEQRQRDATPEEIDAHKAWTQAYEHWYATRRSYDDPPRPTWDGPSISEHHRRGERVMVVTETRRRRAKFLSSFDYQESSPLYFLCEMPRTSATTVEEAFEALMPTPVKLAIYNGLEVTRQGDVFAIPTSLTTRELKSRAKLFEVYSHEQVTTETGVIGTRPVMIDVPLRKQPVVLDTNHTASEVIVTKDGETYGRGILRHEPGGRDRDHARRRMGDGKTWHRLLKNTVPTTKATSNAGQGGWGTRSNQSGQSRAWTIGGGVD